MENDAATIGDYLHLLGSAHRFGIDHMLQRAAMVLQTTAEKYLQDLTGDSFFYAFKFEVDSPELHVVDLGIQYEEDLTPALLDLVKGESVPIDPSDGRWQYLPQIAP